MIARILKTLEASKYRRQVKAVAELCFAVMSPLLRWAPGGERCPVCGARLLCLFRPVIGDGLAQAWGLDRAWRDFFDQREGQICMSCGASLRVRHLAATVVAWLKEQGGRASNAAAARREGLLTDVQIAEINNCGALHKQLVGIPSLAYSEYLPENQAVQHEDMVRLSYPNESFDLVLHSETLEHTPDVDRALAEIHRVLKPGGVTIFTAPMVRDGRDTLVRAIEVDGATQHLLPPTHHGGACQATRQYLVYYEFGRDFPARVSRAGFDVTLHEHPGNPAVVTFVAHKAEELRRR